MRLIWGFTFVKFSDPGEDILVVSAQLPQQLYEVSLLLAEVVAERDTAAGQRLLLQHTGERLVVVQDGQHLPRIQTVLLHRPNVSY